MTKHKTLFHSLLMCSACVLVLTGCGFTMTGSNSSEITSINIIDRNGMSETISVKDRLKPFEKTDFLAPQPYQKVLRVYGRDDQGQIRSSITSYHPNGQVKQCLEAVNNRAMGRYQEWHTNGVQKVEALIIGGMADINTAAEGSWLFDEHCKAWDENGNLIADILYSKGELEGISTYYHSNKEVWKTIPYKKNQVDGTLNIYLENGSCFSQEEYKNGVKHGHSIRYWDNTSLAFDETYNKGRLSSGHYTDRWGNQVSEIKEGNGFRAIFGKKQLNELREYQNGVQEGEVKVFSGNQKLCRTFFVKNGEKVGPETHFYNNENSTPKLLMNWRDGVLHGIAQTWYPNGNVQSLREMSQNKKCGLSTAWYESGALMLVEEYDNDKLIKGEYYRKGEKNPISKINKGKGVATLFDSKGTFLQKTMYCDGLPDNAS